MKTNFARIVVQKSFCVSCCDRVKSKVKEITQVDNIAVYPLEALIVFNFRRAHQVSEVLNTLIALGYPPQGDHVMQSQLQLERCCCDR